MVTSGSKKSMMATDKMQTQGFKMAEHKPTTATSIMYTIETQQLPLVERLQLDKHIFYDQAHTHTHTSLLYSLNIPLH